jgi:hypothetical protein
MSAALWAAFAAILWPEHAIDAIAIEMMNGDSSPASAGKCREFKMLTPGASAVPPGRSYDLSFVASICTLGDVLGLHKENLSTEAMFCVTVHKVNPVHVVNGWNWKK